MREVEDSTDDHGQMVLFQTGHVPNSPLSDDRDISAPHIGYANFLFADDHVQMIGENVNFHLDRALSRGAGAEVVVVF